MTVEQSPIYYDVAGNPMTYQEFVQLIEANDLPAILSRLSEPRTIRMIHAFIGMVSEIGEIADVLKKYVIYGKPLDMENMKEELGDHAWYTQLMHNTLGVTEVQVREMNIAKLVKRYPHLYFREKDALARADEKCDLLDIDQTTKYENDK